MKHNQPKLNKAISDSISSLATDGVNVKVTIDTNTLVKIGVLIIASSIFIGLTSVAVHKLK